VGKSGRKSGKLSSVDLRNEEKIEVILAMKAYDFTLSNHGTNGL
jgi:hypothetical protein